MQSLPQTVVSDGGGTSSCPIRPSVYKRLSTVCCFPQVGSITSRSSSMLPVSKPLMAPWYLALVLEVIWQPSFEILDQFNLKALSLKTVMLLALASAKHISNIHICKHILCVQFLRVRLGFYRNLILHSPSELSTHHWHASHLYYGLLSPSLCFQMAETILSAQSTCCRFTLTGQWGSGNLTSCLCHGLCLTSPIMKQCLWHLWKL